MKYIVLYVLASPVIFAVEALGQKPFIDLLPSHNEIHYQQRVIDTSNSITSNSITSNSITSNIAQPGSEIHFLVSDYSPETDSCRINNDRNRIIEESPVKKPNPLNRLIFPIKFMILDITAYKP